MRSVDIVVPRVATLVIIEFPNLIDCGPAQSPLQFGPLAHLGAVVIQREGFDMRSEAGRVGCRVRRGRGDANEKAIALLKGGTAGFVGVPIAFLALFTTVTRY